MLHRLFSTLVEGLQLHEENDNTHPDTSGDESPRAVSIPGAWPSTAYVAPHGPSSGFFAGSSNVDASHGVFIDVPAARDVNIRVEMQENDKKILDKLPRAEGAGFQSDNHAICLEGTRKAELARIEKWVGDYMALLIYWLGGIAGIGKSTIAQTIAKRCLAGGQMGAAFFCSRDFSDRRNIRLIFPTLAYHLAHRSPEFRAELIQILNECPDISSVSLAVQFEDFIIRPLLKAKLPTIIIIDALDECEDSEPASAILSVMARHIHSVPFAKFFVTGRPEQPIRSGFRLRSLRPHTEVFMLHEVDRTMVDQDIELYLRTHLSEIGADRGYTVSWPSKEEIAAATKKCGGLFIVAYVIVKFVGSRRHDPRERLRILISRPDDTVREGKSGLDVTYDKVLMHGFNDINSEDKTEFFDRLLIVIGSIVLVFDPRSRASLAKILGITLGEVRIALDSLHSIFIVPDSELEPIQIYHKSLADYLTDPKRCTDPRFYINPLAVHLELGLRCLGLMNGSLKTNICDLPRYSMNADIEDLAMRREKYIGSGLEYACRSWAKHLVHGSRDGDNVGHVAQLLDEFFRHHLLQWLEVLSIVGDVSCAVYSFRDVRSWLNDVILTDTWLLAIVQDSEKFVARFFEAIESSATHIYESALPLSPLSSLVRELYRGDMSRDVKMHGMGESWDACVKEIQSQHGVCSVAFSHKEDVIAVGEFGGVVEIFQVATGQRPATFALPTNGDVQSLVFSPDDAILVTGCRNGIVSVLDLQTGGVVDSAKGHTSSITSVVFSPCGSMIATSSPHDSCIRIWDSSPLSCRCILEGHLREVRTVCWSGTGREVISGSDDNTIKVWSLSTKMCTKTLAIHTNAVRSTTSLPDSSLVASGSWDGTIKVFDAETGNVHHTISTNSIFWIRFLNRNQIVYVSNEMFAVRDLRTSVDVATTFKCYGDLRAISSDGTFVVSSKRGVVKIWQTNLQNEGQDMVGHHADPVLCISFSNDGQLVATGSRDKTTKIWDASTGQCLTTFRGHPYSVDRVLFSPDSSVCASAGSGQIAIWDVHSGSQISTLAYSNPFDYSKDMCFSPNGSQLAFLETSYSDSDWVKLWDITTGNCLSSTVLPSEVYKCGEISFDVDGSSITVKGINTMQRWRISSSIESATDGNTANNLSSLPMIFVPIDSPPSLDRSPMPRQPYRYDEKSSWILDKDDTRLLWILPDWGLSHRKSHFHGKKFVFTSSAGRVMIGEFLDVTSSLSKV